MALSVDYLYNFTLSLIRKNMSGALGNEDFERFWNDEQYAYMSALLGRFQAENNSKTGANTGLIQDETIMQKISPFIKKVTIIGGVTNMPSDLLYRLSLMVGNYNCYKTNFNQRSSVINSVIDPPSVTANNYYFFEYSNQYEILPSSVASAQLDYVFSPEPIKWGFTWDDDNRQVYNVGLSKQPLWDTISCLEITKRGLKNIGVSYKDQDFENFGQNAITTGE